MFFCVVFFASRRHRCLQVEFFFVSLLRGITAHHRAKCLAINEIIYKNNDINIR